jgi:hypothetical protein
MKKTLLLAIFIFAGHAQAQQVKMSLNGSNLKSIDLKAKSNRLDQIIKDESSVVQKRKSTDSRVGLTLEDSKISQEKLTIFKTGNEAGGGGNSVGSMLIEGYAVSIEQIEGYSSVAKPILEKIKRNFPNLSSEIDRSLDRLTWYLLPTELAQINESISGAPSSSTQVATQDLINDEVFIDANSFKKLDLNNKGALLLHEIFLDLRCWSGNNCSMQDHAKVRKLVATLLISEDIVKWKSALTSVFMLYSSYPGEYARLVFTADEETQYRRIFEKWEIALHESCKDSVDTDYDKIAQALSKADNEFQFSDICSGDAKNICKGLPSSIWNLFTGNRYEIYADLGCKTSN